MLSYATFSIVHVKHCISTGWKCHIFASLTKTFFQVGAPGGLQGTCYTLSLREQLKLSQNVPDVLIEQTRSTLQDAGKGKFGSYRKSISVDETETY